MRTPTLLFGAALLCLSPGLALTQKAEWASVEDKMPLPILKIAGDFDDAAACAKLGARVTRHDGCTCDPAMIDASGNGAHLVRFKTNSDEEEVYLGVKSAQATEVRYYALGRHVTSEHGTGGGSESSLALQHLSHGTLLGAPSLVIDIIERRVFKTRFGYYLALEDCNERLRKGPEDTPDPQAIERCVEAESAAFVPESGSSEKVYRFIFPGDKARLGAAWVTQRRYQDLHSQGQAPPISVSSYDLRMDGLSWSFPDYRGTVTPKGTFKEGPALPFELKEGEKTFAY